MRGSRIWALVAIGLSVLAVSALLAAGVQSWPIDPKRVVEMLNSATTPVSGLHWARPGRVSFTALPWPMLRILGVELLDADDRSVLSAPGAEIKLSPRQLLGQEFSPNSVKLSNPTAEIDLDARRHNSGPIAAALMSQSMRMDVEGGVARVVSTERGFDTLIENVDGWLDWTNVNRPLSFSLAGLWRGEPVAVEGRVASPLRIRRGGASEATLAITARLAELAFAGTWNADGIAGLEGELTTQIRSRDAFERWLALDAAPSLWPQHIALKGHVAGGPGMLALSEARLEVDGQRFDGSLALSKSGGKASVSGTLAADALDVEALGRMPGPILDSGEQWSRQPLLPAPSEQLEVDLRLSASRASWRGHRIDDVAVSVRQRDGLLTFKLLDATAYQGELTGEFSIQRTPGGSRSQASVSLVNGDLGALLGEFGVTAYSGRGGLEGTVRGAGVSPAELAASMNGSATLELQSGAIDGVNFEEALRRSQRRHVDPARDMATGQTKFSRGSARLEIADGEARIVDAHLEGPGVSVHLQGGIDIAAREWRTRIEAAQASAIGEPSVDAARLTIGLVGPWATPTVAALASSE